MESYNIEIDLVYLWVNGNDPIWQAKRNAFIGKPEEKSQTNCKGRFADNDELKYSLRSIEMYSPWIRKIFIVTDNQTPEWIDTSNTKIKIIDHKEIMPEQCLPCFNSCLIEHFLYRIPGLSEHFLYANDDMFINSTVFPETFYTNNGFPIVRLINSKLRDFFLSFKKHFLRIPLKYYMGTIKTSAKLIERNYGIYYSGKPHHNIDAYLKSDYQRAHEMFRKEISETLSNHTRKDNDVQRCLYTYFALAEKHGYKLYVNQKTSFRFHIQNHKHYKKLEKYNPIFFCMNDSEYANDDDRKMVKEFLEKRFPTKSEFEK